VSVVLAYVRQDAPASRTDLCVSVTVAFRRVVSAGVAVVPLVLLQKRDLSTAGWTRKIDHAAVRRPSGANKGFSMISKNETLRVIRLGRARKPFYRKAQWAPRATIAQSVEQPPCKRQVGSSILPGGSVTNLRSRQASPPPIGSIAAAGCASQPVHGINNYANGSHDYDRSRNAREEKEYLRLGGYRVGPYWRRWHSGNRNQAGLARGEAARVDCSHDDRVVARRAEGVCRGLRREPSGIPRPVARPVPADLDRAGRIPVVTHLCGEREYGARVARRGSPTEVCRWRCVRGWRRRHEGDAGEVGGVGARLTGVDETDDDSGRRDRRDHMRRRVRRGACVFARLRPMC